MITVKYSHYLPFLASGNNILILNNEKCEAFDKIRVHFNSFIQYSLDIKTLDDIDAALVHYKINIVVINAVGNGYLARQFFDRIKKYNNRIVAIVITSFDADRDELSLIRDCNASLFAPFSEQELNSRLFSTLGIFYVIKSIGRREISLKHDNTNEAINKNYFLDIYQGQALFVVDELSELNSSLAHGELSYEILNKITDKLEEISKIFQLSNDLISVSPIIDELVKLIKSIDLQTLDPRLLKTFDYLVNIIDDINSNIMDLFVDRIIKDVNEFSHSLESNIKYIRMIFMKQNNQESQAEFFHD